MFNWLQDLTIQKIRLFVIISVSLLMVDALSKIAIITNMQLYDDIPILPIFNLTFIINTGVSFSFLNNLDYRLILVVSFLSYVLSFIVIASLYKKVTFEVILILALLTAGTLGNWFDRIFNYGVIDFLHLYYGQWHFPIFNLADCMITLSTILILKSFFINKNAKGK